MATVSVLSGTDEARWRDDPQLASVPEVDSSELATAGSRAVIVAPHPDDEILACAGLIMQLALRGNPILLIAVSDGEHSHGSEVAERVALLSQLRPAETLAALAQLNLHIGDIQVIRAQLPDGAVAQHADKLFDLLSAHLRPGDTVFSTWQQDGHPDHEAVGKVCFAWTRAHGRRLIQVPVWTWHWRTPAHAAIPWFCARKLMLNDDMQARKQAALQCFRSQLGADHGAAILPPEVLAHFQRPFEIYFV